MLPFPEFHQDRTGPRLVRQDVKGPPNFRAIWFRGLHRFEYLRLAMIDSAHGKLLKKMREPLPVRRIIKSRTEGNPSVFRVREGNCH
jgi:hypothetical protein